VRVVSESDEVYVTILRLCGQQSAYVQEDGTVCAMGTCDHCFVDPVAGLFALETGLAWPCSCVIPCDLHPSDRTLVSISR
jgi:hypothetical protein